MTGWFELSKSSDGPFRFNLKATNGQVIGTSPMHGTEPAREAAIASAKVMGASKTVKDNT